MSDLKQLLNCAWPLVFMDSRSGDQSFGGTCFVIERYGHYYVLTARHCIERSFDPENVAILCGPDPSCPISFKVWHRFKTGSLLDTDQGDIAVFEIDNQNSSPAEISRLQPFTVDPRSAGITTLPQDFFLIVHGYPIALSAYSYDVKTWLRESYYFRARYSGETKYNGISRLTFDECGELNHLDGISGSPVFALAQRTDRVLKCALAGMVIRGSVESKSALFIRSAILIRAIVSIQENLLFG